MMVKTIAIIATPTELTVNTPNAYNTERRIPFVGKTLIKVITLITKGNRQEKNKRNLNIIFWLVQYLTENNGDLSRTNFHYRKMD